MKVIVKKIMPVMFALAVAFAFMPLLPGHSAYAIELGEYSITYNNFADDFEEGWIDLVGDTVKINTDETKTYSENTAVAQVYAYATHISIDARGKGETDIIVTGTDDSTCTVHVVVTDKYMQGWMKRDTSIDRCWYGTTKLVIYGMEGSYGTVKVGSKTYKVKKLGKSEKRTIKLKKPSKLKLNTKVTLKLTRKGTSVTIKDKLKSVTEFESVKGSKKKIKIKTLNVHKGDKIKIKYKGRTYTKKVTKNYDGKYKTFTLKTKKKVSKTASLTITIKNKNKKTLFHEKVKLSEGKYTVPDPDSDPNPDSDSY